jgi:tetratricopeptide (TPR) repeat protein
VVIDHTGYQEASRRRGKLERNLKLLLLEEAEQPDDSFTLFNLGRTYLDLERTTEALAIFRRSLERSKPSLSIVRKLYALITQGHLQLGQRVEALKVCREGQTRYPDDPELLFQEAMLLREQRDFAGAEAALVRLVKAKPGKFFDMVDAGLRSYKARHHLAVTYYDQGRLSEAEAQWRSALAERPTYTAAWLGLAEIFLTQKRWDEFEQAAGQIDMQTPETIDAGILRGRGHLARDDMVAARGVLEDVIRCAPQELRPRVLLTHALLREGKDWEAAEKALRDVLALAPDHAEARQNLTVLLRRQGREVEI